MDINNKKDKLWTKDYIIIIIAASGISFTTHFFLSTLPIYAQRISNTVAYAGIMTGAYTLAALAVRPLSGILTDRIGRTKLLILGAIICSIACLMYNFAGTVILLIFLRIINGIGFGIHTTAAGAVAADVIPKARMMEGIGYFGLYGTIAFAIAPGISLSIIGDGQIEKFRTLFILAAAVSIISMILDSCITYEREKKKLSAHGHTLKEKEMVVSHNSVNVTPYASQLPRTFLGFEYGAFLPAIVILLVYLGQSSITSFLALYSIKYNIGNIGLFFTFLAVGMLISRLFFGKIGDKRGPNIIVIPAIIVLAFCYLLIPLAGSLYPLLSIAFPYGLSLGIISPAMNAMIINRCSPQRRGTASAAYFSALDIGIGVGSIFFGFIVSMLGYTYMFAGSFIFTIAALVIYIFGLAGSKNAAVSVQVK